MEYARYGDGFVRRESAEQEWEQGAAIPDEELRKVEQLESRKQRVGMYGFDPAEPPRQFARILTPDDPDYQPPAG